MTSELILPLIVALGGLGAIVGFLTFLNTRKGAKGKSDNEAYSVFSQWVAGAMGQAAAENKRLTDTLTAERGVGATVKALLVALVLELIDELRKRGASYDEVVPYHARLDEARRL